MGVSYLLDTHVFFWLAHSPDRVPQRVRARIADVAAAVLVSDISAFEVATKVRLGKFDPARALVGAWRDALQRVGAQPLPLGTAHALRAGALVWDNRDPFDRLIAGQAVEDELTMVTADPRFAGLPDLDLMAW
jgi:PIN domain nuclease of toxin-antitoxin system